MSISKSKRSRSGQASQRSLRSQLRAAREPFSDDALRLVARLYYEDMFGQTQIARVLKISQAKVSRLLRLARERGVVRITVAEYEPRHAELERQLQRALGLHAVAVIRAPEGVTSSETRSMVGHFGAAFVADLIPRGSIVAIAGGRTIRELIAQIPEDRQRAVTVVQAMGSIDSTVTVVDAFELGRTLAQRLGGYFLTLNTPAFVPDKKTRDAFLGLHQIRTVWEHFQRTDVALVGVGTLENSVFVDRGVLSPAEREELRHCGAVGEICGRFYNQQGRECDSPWRERVLSIELDRLRRVPEVVAIVVGADRAEALAAGIRGDLIKSLIIDEQGARSLLQVAQGRTADVNRAEAGASG